MTKKLPLVSKLILPQKLPDLFPEQALFSKSLFQESFQTDVFISLWAVSLQQKKSREQERTKKERNKWERILQLLTNTVSCIIQMNASFFFHSLCFFKKTLKGKRQLWTRAATREMNRLLFR